MYVCIYRYYIFENQPHHLLLSIMSDVITALPSNLTNKSKLIQYSPNINNVNKKQVLSEILRNIRTVVKSISPKKKDSSYTHNELDAAGFEYIDERDIILCNQCGLEVSQRPSDMSLFQMHSVRHPDCPFILSKKVAQSFVSTSYATPSKVPQPSTSSACSSSSSAAIIRSASVSSDQGSPLKRQKVEFTQESTDFCKLFEINTVQQIRRRTFSHWPHRTTPSQAQMIEAGFFNCNVGDRVICIYCNLICQQWTPHTDDPCEVHITLSPNCIYVKAKLMRREPGSILIVNQSSVGVTTNNLDQVRCNELVHTAACNVAYSELPKRHASFTAWPEENLPPVEELVKAGFFYTGTKNIVTCFYCNGSLQNWGPNDNPTIEHARWFPHCAYAKQLCGDDLYRKIQESKRAQQGLFNH